MLLTVKLGTRTLADECLALYRWKQAYLATHAGRGGVVQFVQLAMRKMRYTSIESIYLRLRIGECLDSKAASILKRYDSRILNRLIELRTLVKLSPERQRNVARKLANGRTFQEAIR